MSSPDNRPTQLFLVGFALIAAATVVAAVLFGKWAVIVPIVLIPAWRFSRTLEVRGQIAAKGWSGRRFKDYWVYEEIQGRDKPSISIKLHREGADRLVFVVPDEAEWQRTMPLWAQSRRREIVDRILTAWSAADVRWPPGEGPSA